MIFLTLHLHYITVLVLFKKIELRLPCTMDKLNLRKFVYQVAKHQPMKWWDLLVSLSLVFTFRGFLMQRHHGWGGQCLCFVFSKFVCLTAGRLKQTEQSHRRCQSIRTQNMTLTFKHTGVTGKFWPEHWLTVAAIIFPTFPSARCQRVCIEMQQAE